MNFAQRIAKCIRDIGRAIADFFTNTKKTHIGVGSAKMAKGDVIMTFLSFGIIALPIPGARILVLPLKFVLNRLTLIGLDRYTHLKTDTTDKQFIRQFAVYTAVALVGGAALFFLAIEIPSPLVLVILTQLPIYL